MMQWWGDYLDEVQGIKSEGIVVRLRGLLNL